MLPSGMRGTPALVAAFCLGGSGGKGAEVACCWLTGRWSCCWGLLMTGGSFANTCCRRCRNSGVLARSHIFGQSRKYGWYTLPSTPTCWPGRTIMSLAGTTYTMGACCGKRCGIHSLTGKRYVLPLQSTGRVPVRVTRSAEAPLSNVYTSVRGASEGWAASVWARSEYVRCGS